MLRMNSLRTLRNLSILSTRAQREATHLSPNLFCRYYAALPEEDASVHNPTISDGENDSHSVFDSSHFRIPSINSDATAQASKQQPSWDQKYREKADELIFGKENHKAKLRVMEEGVDKRRRILAKALLEAALDAPDNTLENEHLVVKEEDQKSLSVGIIGAPNAGKSALTNYMVSVFFPICPLDIFLYFYEVSLINFFSLRMGK